MNNLISFLENLYPVFEKAFKQKQDWAYIFNRIDGIVEELKFAPLTQEQKDRIRRVIEKMIKLFEEEGIK
jgi:hypothetical protein